MYQTKRYEKEITVKDYLTQYVNIEEFLEYCKACKNYDRLWSCPSTTMILSRSLLETVRKAVYPRLSDFLRRGNDRSGEPADHGRSQGTYERGIVCDGSGASGVCIAVSGQLQRMRRRKLHQTAGRALRISDKLQYSIESIGGNVGKTVHDFWESRSEWIGRGQGAALFLCWFMVCSNRRLALRSETEEENPWTARTENRREKSARESAGFARNRLNLRRKRHIILVYTKLIR